MARLREPEALTLPQGERIEVRVVIDPKTFHTSGANPMTGIQPYEFTPADTPPLDDASVTAPGRHLESRVW